MMQNFLKKMMVACEQQMKAKLQEIRLAFQQSGDKGENVENSLREFLRSYLPRRLEIGTGEIIDAKGRRSKQTDVVVATEDHPFTFTREKPGLFFVEGVCAAGEVKSILTSEELANSLENSHWFKGLEVNPGVGTMIHSNESDKKRFYMCPPWFLFAFESQLKLENIINNINEFSVNKGIIDNKLLDAVFVLNRGWVINLGDGKGRFQIYETGAGEIQLQRGWVFSYDNDSVLFDFIAWLSTVMPRMIRFEPILPNYFLAATGNSLEDQTWKRE